MGQQSSKKKQRRDINDSVLSHSALYPHRLAIGILNMLYALPTETTHILNSFDHLSLSSTLIETLETNISPKKTDRKETNKYLNTQTLHN